MCSSLLFVPPRSKNLSLGNGHVATAISLSRLKRTNPQASSGPMLPASSVSCIFSCYLVTIARVSCLAHSQSTMHRVAPRMSTIQLIEEFARDDGALVHTSSSNQMNGTATGSILPSPSSTSEEFAIARDCLGSGAGAGGLPQLPSTPSQVMTTPSKVDSSPSHTLTHVRSSSLMNGSRKSVRRRSDSTDHFDAKALSAAAKLAVKVGLEILSSLSSLYDEPADDAVYRALVDACGACGLGRE